MRKIATLAIALERAQQERDAVIKELRPPIATPLEGSAWQLLGRLKSRTGAAYRFLHVAKTQQWITSAELEAELAQADKS